MKVSTFSGFMQEKIEFILNGHELSEKGSGRNRNRIKSKVAASVHDSQVAIPLTIMSSGRATYLYELMDAGYDMPEIRTAERGFSELKDNYGIEKSRFRGYAKIKAHAGFAMIVLTMRKIFQHEYRFQNIIKLLENAA